MVTKLVFELLGFCFRLTLEVILLSLLVNCAIAIVPNFLKKGFKFGFSWTYGKLLKPASIKTYTFYKGLYAKGKSKDIPNETAITDDGHNGSNVVIFSDLKRKAKGN